MNHIRATARGRLALAGAAFALGLLAPAISRAACQIKRMELPVRMVGQRAIATLGINGTPVPLIVDSGAFFSMLSDAAAAQLHLPTQPLPPEMRVVGLAGKVQARLTTVNRLRIGQGEIPDADFIVGGNEPGAGAMGLLGRNVLSFIDTEYDLAHGVIRLVLPNADCDDANMAYWAGDTPVAELALPHPFRENNPEIRARIELNGHKVDAVFDTGASTIVSLDAAHKAGVKDADMTPEGQVAGAGAGRVAAWTADFAKVDFGGEAVLHNRLEVADFDMDEDMLVGIDFFLSHHVYVSKKQSRLYFTYNGGPVFSLNHDASPPPARAASDAGPEKADELARRGLASQARGDLAGALADLDRACALEPGDAGFHAARAGIQRQLGHPELALADLDAALRLAPAQADARLARAALLADAGRRDDALADLATLDGQLPPESDLRHSMAALYERLDRPALALAQWNAWIPAHRHDVEMDQAWNARCWARVALGIELDQALDDCDNAVRADDRNASFLDSRGWVRLRQGETKKALADFDRSLAINPKSAWSLYGRALVRLRLGDAAAAQADLAAARRVDKDIDARIAAADLPKIPDAP